MSTIITGIFAEQTQAQDALQALTAAGFAADQMTSFYLSDAAQHEPVASGHESDDASGLKDVAEGTATGGVLGGAVGVAVGLVSAPVLGPGAVVAGIGVGAYVGSLYGALEHASDPHAAATGHASSTPPAHHPQRHSGMLVAVAAPTVAEQEQAIQVLRGQAAADISRSSGKIVAGEWDGFNSDTTLTPVPE
jgi:hypothetical protein